MSLPPIRLNSVNWPKQHCASLLPASQADDMWGNRNYQIQTVRCGLPIRGIVETGYLAQSRYSGDC
jgi:hypothetical protein